MCEQNDKVLTIDVGHDIPVFSPICTFCVHVDPILQNRRCAAFPDGIPMEIWPGRYDHTKPAEGDNGVVFQRIAAAP